MPVTDYAFIRGLLADPGLRRELEEEFRRKWEAFTLRLLAWEGESEELRSPPLTQAPVPDPDQAQTTRL